MKGEKQIRLGLPLISLYCNVSGPEDAYCNTQFSAVETRLDKIPANMVVLQNFLEANHHQQY